MIALKRTETWYENVKFPNDFRIDFGNPIVVMP